MEVQLLSAPGAAPTTAASSFHHKARGSLVMKNAGCWLVFLTRNLLALSDAVYKLKQRENALLVSRVFISLENVSAEVGELFG